jgi:site-specific recombinase XerD
MRIKPLGQVVHSFFLDYLKVQKGLLPTSIRSYRDVIKLFLCFVADKHKHKITNLTIEDITFEDVQQFLNYLEQVRGNHIRTRNQRLAALHTFFEYAGRKIPEMLSTCQQVAGIPVKRTSPSETHFLEREHIAQLFASLPSKGHHVFRDRAILLFLYNTGARVQEVADLRVGNLQLGLQPRVRLHGKGDKWRTCPLWQETVHQLEMLLRQKGLMTNPENPVFTAGSGRPLTRFGIYKLVRRHTCRLEQSGIVFKGCHISPHIFRHTAAVHLLEAGVECNVIREWLGHVSLDTTNRYAEINMKAKEAALRICQPPASVTGETRRSVIWKEDQQLLEWLNSL